jgi:hypothetical protein
MVEQHMHPILHNLHFWISKVGKPYLLVAFFDEISHPKYVQVVICCQVY